MAGPWERYQEAEAGNSPGPWTKYASEQEAPVVAGEPTAIDYASGFLGGANTGLAGMVGLPVDLVNAGLGAIGVPTSDAPFLGSQWFKNRMGNVAELAGKDPALMTNSGPDDTLGRVLNRTGQELGATVAPGAALLAKGVRTAGTLPPIPQSVMRGGVDSVLRGIGQSPGRAAAGELAAATGAGLGAGAARELYPDSPVAEMAGQLAGGFAPTALANMPASLATRGFSAIARRVSSDAQRRAAESVARDFTGGEIAGSAGERLREANRIADEIPGFNPSLAERTQSPGLLAKQRDLESQAAGQELDAMVGRRLANENAIDRYAGNVAPQSDRGPQFVVDAAKRSVTDLRSRVDTGIRDMEDARRNLAGNIPAADQQAEGAALRASLQDRIGEEHTAFERLATATGLNNESFRVDFQPFRSGLLDAFNQASKFQTTTGKRVTALPSVVRVIEDAQTVQSFPALMELRADISAAIRTAERLPSTDDATLRGLKAMKARFDFELENAVSIAGDPEIAQRYRTFRTRYLSEFIEPYRQRASYDVLHKDKQGAYETTDERVAQTYFKPGGVTEARQFKQVFGQDQTANQAIEAIALDSLRRAAVKDGVLDPRAYRRWMVEHQSVLNEFPAIARKTQTYGEINDALMKRQASLVKRAQAIEDSLLWRELKAIDADARTPENAIARAINSPRKMLQIAGRARRSPEASAALQRAVWDQLVGFEPGEIARFINENGASLSIAGLSADHLKSLKVIDGARTMSRLLQMPAGSPDIPTARESFARMFGVPPEMIANRLHTLNTGRSEKSWVVVNLLTNIISRKQQGYLDDAFRVILYDAQAAKDLAQTIKLGTATPAAARRLQARYFALGLTPQGDQEGPQEQPAGGRFYEGGTPASSGFGATQ